MASRRTLITAAAALAAGPALAQRTEEGGEGVLVAPSRSAAMRQRIAGTVAVVLCTGYARAGDRGQALYARVAAEPRHAGKFRSADGAWWELAENRLNPFMFGARAALRIDDAPAIQAMFDFVADKGVVYPVSFVGARYYLAAGIRLPTVPAFLTMDVDGGGAILVTDRPVTIFGRIPVNQADATRCIGAAHFDIHHFEFRGRGLAGQVGVHIGAAYCNLVRNCTFSNLEYGTIGSFCLAGAWRDNLYHLCTRRAAVVQTGTGYDSGPVWPGAVETNSASNVSVFENCRVFGHPGQESAFGIFGSDAVRVNGCISEGHGAATDLHFDYQRSPTVKQFHVDGFHCEAPRALLNFKVRATGKVVLERVIRSYPAALYDARGSTNCEVMFRGLAWLGGMPEASGTGPNPRGRWFYHSGGAGFGAAREGERRSGGTGFRFEDCVEEAWKAISDPERWESGRLPEMLHIRGIRMANNGVMEWSNAPISFASPISFAAGDRFNGIETGTVAPATASVPARASVTESFAAPGLVAATDAVTLNPLTGAHAPPPGIAWNAWIERDGMLALRLTNVTDRAVALTPGAQWAYCATRRG